MLKINLVFYFLILLDLAYCDIEKKKPKKQNYHLGARSMGIVKHSLPSLPAMWEELFFYSFSDRQDLLLTCGK